MRRAIRYALIAVAVAAAALSAVSPGTAQISNSCQKFVGLWSWNSPSTKIEIKPDGTADILCALCDKNLRWTCDANTFKLSCCVFGVDLNLSADGKQMSGARGTIVRLSAPPQTGSTSATAPPSPAGVNAPPSRATLSVPAPLAVAVTPAQAAKLLGAPPHALPHGLYTLDGEYDFNVLDAVYYDARTHQLSLVGHRDESIKGSRIPYIQHLATLFANPFPRFTLNLTPDSYRRANAFFNWSPSREQADKFNKQLYDVIDPHGNVTANGRLLLPSFGVYPVSDNKAPGYLGVETQLTKDGLTAVTNVAPGSPAARLGIIPGDWITFFDDGPIARPTDRPVYHPQDLAHRVRFAGTGTTVNLTYQRGGQAYKKAVTLTADSKDPWLGFTRYNVLAALYRASGDERAALVIEAFSLLKDTPMGNPALGATLAKFSAILNPTPQSSPEGRGQAIARRLDEIFGLPGNPVLASYNANFAKSRDAVAAIRPALDRMDAALAPKVLELLERPLDQPEGFQIPPEVVDRLWNVRVEMTPEYRGVPGDSLLARAMFDADYLTKRLTNSPELKLRFPNYQTEFEYRRAHGLNKENGAFRTWLSVAKLDLAQSSSGNTLELGDVQMRFNIRKLDRNAIDLPDQQPNGYEDLLTSLYNDFEHEYPTLHELREIAKLTAAAAWLHGKTPSLHLPIDGAVKWHGPAKVPGLAYTYLYNRDRKLFYQMIVEGGVNLNLEPFLWPSTGVVDARGTPGGGAPSHGAPSIPTSASVVDLHASAGGILTAPPDENSSIGWVVRTNATQGNRQSVSLRLDSIGAGPVQTQKPSLAVCQAMSAQITELHDAKLRAEMASRVYDIYASPNSAVAPPPSKSCTSLKSDVPSQFALISGDKLNGNLAEIRNLIPGAGDATIHQLIDPAQSDYRVAIYRDQKSKKIFVVFRGTQSTDDLGSADVPQAFGERTEYYSKAVALARLLKQSPDIQAHGVEFIGHSLGGGLAAAAAVEACGPTLPSAPPRRWKCSATTFNAAGVHPNTEGGKDLFSAEAYVDAYVLEGEPLNSSQDNRARTISGVTSISVLAAPLTGGMSAMVPAWVGAKVAGNGTEPLPPSIGRRVTLPAWTGAPPPQMVGRHTMACVHESIDRRIAYMQRQYATECAPRVQGTVPPPPPEAFEQGAR